MSQGLAVPLIVARASRYILSFSSADPWEYVHVKRKNEQQSPKWKLLFAGWI
jgi:hypothetical protein